MLMDEHLSRMAAEFGDRTAFSVVDVGSLTFAEWDGAANALARRLLDSGLEPGARVGIHLRPELATWAHHGRLACGIDPARD